MVSLIRATPASFKHLSANSTPFIPVPFISGNIKKPDSGSLNSMPDIFFNPLTINFFLVINFLTIS